MATHPPVTPDPLTPAQRRALRAAAGWLQLGLPNDARAEIATLPPHRDVLACRLAIATYQSLWSDARDLAETLCHIDPEDPQWPVSLAYATRRARSLPEAEAILRHALTRFPEESVIPYNLACYAAQLGRLAEARTLLEAAVALDPAVRDLAASDPDLLPLRQS